MSVSIINSNTNLTQNSVDYSYNWPVTISENVTITLLQDISFNNLNNYFIIDGNNITFNGNNKTITISDVSGYNGIFTQSISLLGLPYTSYIQNTTIKNLGVLSNNSSLANYGGWICQSSFGALNQNVLISNCYSTGEIGGMSSGGIFGWNCAYGGNLTIENCFTTGKISGKYAGGIIGSDGCYSFTYNFNNPSGDRGFTSSDTGNDDEM